MKCPISRDTFIAFANRELPPDVEREVAAHLANCPACQQEAAAWLTLTGRIRDYFPSAVAAATVPSDAWARIQARTARPLRFPWTDRSTLMKHLPALATLAIVLGIIFGANAYIASNSSMTGGGPQDDGVGVPTDTPTPAAPPATPTAAATPPAVESATPFPATVTPPPGAPPYGTPASGDSGDASSVPPEGTSTPLPFTGEVPMPVQTPSADNESAND